jgi:hypothetical protein
LRQIAPKRDNAIGGRQYICGTVGERDAVANRRPFSLDFMQKLLQNQK